MTVNTVAFVVSGAACLPGGLIVVAPHRPARSAMDAMDNISAEVKAAGSSSSGSLAASGGRRAPGVAWRAPGVRCPRSPAAPAHSPREGKYIRGGKHQPQLATARNSAPRVVMNGALGVGAESTHGGVDARRGLALHRHSGKWALSVLESISLELQKLSFFLFFFLILAFYYFF